MKKMILALILAVMAQSTFALEATSKTVVSSVVELAFSVAITSVTSEIAISSVSNTHKKEALKIIAEVQDYNQTNYISFFLAEKISIVKSIDPLLSNDESVDILLSASELILSN